MRLFASSANSTALQEARQVQSDFTRQIQAYGEPVLLTRPATTPGGHALTFLLQCWPQALDIETAGALMVEGDQNVSEDNPRDFVCMGTADVRARDLITWNGYIWRVAKVNPNRVAGLSVCLHVYGFIQNKVN